MAITPVHIAYHPGTLSLVTDALLCIGLDFDIPKKVISTDNADSLVLTSLATILV